MYQPPLYYVATALLVSAGRSSVWTDAPAAVPKILSMLGLGYKVPEELQDVAAENLDKWKVIMKSMTEEELENPKLIRSSRTQRIARGSGTQPRDVKELLKQYQQSRKFIKSIRKRRGGLRIPGMKGDQKLPRGMR